MPNIKFQKDPIDIPYFLQNTEETLVPQESQIIGEIPQWLAHGSVFGTAPAIFDLPLGSVKHWLDGLPLVFKFKFEETKVTFSKRFIRSNMYNECLKNGKPSCLFYASNPYAKKGILAKLKPFTLSDLSMHDACFGEVMNLGGKNHFIISEMLNYYRFNPNTLEIAEKFNTIKTFGLTSLNPIPIRDHFTGDLYNVGTCLSGAGMVKYSILKLKNPSADFGPPNLETICTIASRWYSCTSILRCFGVTKNYIVFVEQPEVVCALKIASINLKGYCIKDCMEWKGDHEPNKFYVVEKSSGKIIMGQKIQVHSEEPFHSLWTINAYEEGDTVVMDLVTSEDDKIADCFYLENLRKMEKSESIPTIIKRFKIPIIRDPIDTVDHKRNSKDSPEISSTAYWHDHHTIILQPQLPLGTKSGFDNGRINEMFAGRKYTYVYSAPGLNGINSSEYFGKLCKGNVDLGKVITWEPSNARNPETGELKYVSTFPVFIPRPQFQEHGDKNINVSEIVEDDGIVISTFVATSKWDKNFMVFLDAKSFQEVARVDFNEKIPMYCNLKYLP